MSRHRSSLFSIAPGVPFLSTLIEALKNGQLIQDFDATDPLELSRCTFYVPTQRAARSLRTAFIEHSNGNACLLPDIRPLGLLGETGEEEAHFFHGCADMALTLAPPLDALERLLLLARLIRPWRNRLPKHLRALFGVEEIAIPTNSADAIWLAYDLARLMDEVETQEADWTKLTAICPDDVAEWWQISLDFLNIVTQNWPHILAERHLSNPVAWRQKMLRHRTEFLINNPPRGPVIAAGSTGSIPATAAMLRAIANLPQGAVVVPGLDRDMDEVSWLELDNLSNEASIFTHPQYGLKKLLNFLGYERDNVIHLGTPPVFLRQRETYLSAALRPAATTDHWAKMAFDTQEMAAAFADIALSEAAVEREEALTIAVILREAIEDENAHAAFVTNDRTLARRVAAELKRFGIRVDDSSGRPLLESEPVALVRLLLDCIFFPGDVVAFLSVLKHPLTRLGYERSSLRRAVERLELFALRGGTGRISLSETPAFIAERLLQVTENTDEHFAKLDLEWIETASQLGAAIGEACRPLSLLSQSQIEVSLEQALQATIEVFENFGRDETGSVHNLYAHEAGEQLNQFFTRLMATQSDFTFMAAEWPEMFKALMAQETVRTPPFSHPRLAIWGGLESRMQQVDVMVLGGLNEGNWPGTVSGDPFMSRAMKSAMGLEPPERRIGLAAHDFQMAMGTKKVILTRSLRQENAPTVPSRWLQRLLTICGEEQTNNLRQRGETYLHWARALDAAADVPFAPRPCPKPPLDVRPRHFSVTEIDILRRDPYAVYAKRILKLRRLPPLIRDADTAERGQLYHAIVAAFALAMEAKGTNTLPPDEATRIVRAEFDRMQLPIDIEAIWWPRFQLLLPEILHLEQELSPRQRLAEIVSNKVEINDSGFTLSGRADRIDLLQGRGMAEILDFKTGSTPKITQARSLSAPQLALEGALLLRGGFAECVDCRLSNFVYVRLGSQGDVKWEKLFKQDEVGVADLAEAAWNRLDKLVRLYAREDHGYLSHALPRLGKYEGDYDHLARLSEWSAGASHEGDDDD